MTGPPIEGETSGAVAAVAVVRLAAAGGATTGAITTAEVRERWSVLSITLLLLLRVLRPTTKA